MSEDKTQIKIKFFTQEDDEDLHISDAPLYVPVTLKRYGLSEVVNHLLEAQKGLDGRVIPFDFLIDGVLLRTSILEYLTKNGLSNEAFINLEYTRAVLPPSFLASFNNDDWISAIDTINSQSSAVQHSNVPLSQPKILSGLYDGIVRTYNLSGQVEKQYVGHLAPIRAVQWVSPTRVISCGNDRQIRIWKTSAGHDDPEDEEIEEGKTLAILEGHKAPVVSLSVDNKSNRILSASYDHAIGLWLTIYKEMTTVQPLEYDSNVLSTASKKRRKMAVQDSSVRRRSPLAFMEGHSEPVEAVVFDVADTTVGYSASQDHTIKTWDLVTLRCVDTRTTGYSLLSLVQLPEKHLLVSGSSARHINVHDPRISTSSNQTIAKLVGHTNFVVSLATCPNNENMFASGSHDGTVKVWDIRADKALYTITREEDKDAKVLGVAWDKEIGIVSGGDDKKIQINKGSDITR